MNERMNESMNQWKKPEKQVERISTESSDTDSYFKVSVY